MTAKKGVLRTSFSPRPKMRASRKKRRLLFLNLHTIGTRKNIPADGISDISHTKSRIFTTPARGSKKKEWSSIARRATGKWRSYNLPTAFPLNFYRKANRFRPSSRGLRCKAPAPGRLRYTFCMSRILVSGSIAYDRIMDFPGHFRDHFLAHKLNTINVSFAVDAVEENFGGTAGNIAYNLVLLGHDPHNISTAGSDFSAYRKYLEGEGIATDTVHIDTSELTSSAYIITDKADNQIAAFSFGASKRAYGDPGVTEGVACAIVGAGNPEDMRRLPAFYRERKIPYFYDPAH